MTQDATMVGGLQRKQGLTGVTVASGTTLEVASGGVLKVESGGTATIASGGALVIASGAYSAFPTEAAGSTATALAASGLTTLNTTGANTWALAAPAAAGVLKVLTVIDHGATTVSVAVNATGCKILGASTVAAGTSTMTFTSNTSVALMSLGTTSWALVGTKPADVAFS